MSSFAQAEETKYMLRRSLALCLSDPKRGREQGTYIDFDALDEADLEALEILCRPILVLMNVIRAAGRFKRDVLDAFGPTSDQVEDLNSPLSLDWDKMADSWTNGQRTLFFMNESFAGSTEDAWILAVLLQELRGQHQVLTDVFSRKEAPTHSAIREAFRAWDAMCANLSLLTTRMPSSRPVLAAAAKSIEASLVIFRKYIDQLANGDSAPDLYKEYRRLSDPLFCQNPQRVRLAKQALEWRACYSSQAVGLGQGSHLRFTQTRDPAHLFEIWSFLELAYRLSRSGKDAVTQRSFLRGARFGPTFDIHPHMAAYYNFYGDSAGSKNNLASKVISGSHVEWFIRDSRRLEDSVVMDTKYSDWSPREARNVLGYLMEFNVNRGVIIFRGSIPTGALTTSEATDKWAICPVTGGTRTLFVARLLPAREAAAENFAVLDRLIATLEL